MFPFLSTQTNRKDQAAARIGICLFALLFFLCALFSALPSLGSLTDFFSENGLAGYRSQASEHSDEQSAALSRFTDRPHETGTSDDLSDPPDDSGDDPSASASTPDTVGTVESSV